MVWPDRPLSSSMLGLLDGSASSATVQVRVASSSCTSSALSVRVSVYAPLSSLTVMSTRFSITGHARRMSISSLTFVLMSTPFRVPQSSAHGASTLAEMSYVFASVGVLEPT